MRLTRRRHNDLPSGPPAIDRLHDDALRLVIELLYLQDHDALLVCSRVCRRFYLAAIPWIYRCVKIDFSIQSHIRLLSRLAQEGTQIPRHVRVLRILPTDEWDVQQLTHLYLFFTRLTHVVDFRWDNVASIPPFLLAILWVRFPRANITLHARKLGPLPFFRGYLNHLAMRQLTYFALYKVALTVHPVEFKIHLVNLIVNCPALKNFDIVSNDLGGIAECPDLTHCMQGRILPRLKKLRLFTPEPVFKVEELALWGLQGGWNELEDLNLDYESELVLFIGIVPKLKSLTLSPRHAANVQLLERYLNTHPSTPLGPLRKLDYTTYVTDVGGFIPWYILQKISKTVVELDTSHYVFDDGSPDLKTPTADDIRRLRALCPRLQTLVIDARFDKGKLCPNLLSELALLEEPFTLKFYLHRPNMKDRDWSWFDGLDCWTIWKTILKCRRMRGQPTTTRSKVEFKLVRPWAKFKEDWTNPDFECCYEKDSDRHGKFWFTLPVSCNPSADRQNALGKLSADKLTQLRNKLYVQKGVRLGVWWSREVRKANATLERVDKQRQRNEYNKRAEEAFGPNATLYDKWLGDRDEPLDSTDAVAVHRRWYS